MKIRTLFLTFAFLLIAIPALVAKVVSKEQARIVAMNYVNERILCQQIHWEVNNLNLIEERTIKADDQPAIYIFSNNGKGFILIAADDVLTPVLGYSDNGTLSPAGVNSNFEWLLNEYIQQVKYVRNNSVEASPESINAWIKYSDLQTDYSVISDTTTVNPLITTMWNQDSPYNEFCPEDPDGPGGHVYAGCVATAMSMIMNYYKYPITGSGSHSYVSPGYGTQTANFGATTYEWDAMQNTVGASSGMGIPANALLQYHAGVAVNMQYGTDGSGAHSYNVPNAMKTYFKYSTSIEYLERSSYTLSAWETMLMTQLDAFKPLYYSGYDSEGGHAWVCDGYQKIGTTKMFHFNFGWGGANNGYYTSSNPYGFTSGQSIVRNFFPGSSYPYGCTDITLEYSKGSIEDGSGPLALYGTNLACSWLISPVDTVNSITAKFVRFAVNSSDTLLFYDGIDENAPLLAAYTGNSSPVDVTTTGNRMFIKFVTDGFVQDSGWLLEYTSALPSLCSGTKTYTTPIGSFSDGSGEYDYKNNALCKYKIQPLYAMDLTLTFDEFDLSDGDELLIYALSNSELLATLSGNQIPDPITVPFDGLYLVFQSNSYYTAPGFKVSYSVGNVDTKKLPGISSINISPNPANDYVLLRAFVDKTQLLHAIISDMSGKTMFRDDFNAYSGNMERIIDVSNLNSGMYFLTIITAEGNITQKLVIN